MAAVVVEVLVSGESLRAREDERTRWRDASKYSFSDVWKSLGRQGELPAAWKPNENEVQEFLSNKRNYTWRARTFTKAAADVEGNGTPARKLSRGRSSLAASPAPPSPCALAGTPVSMHGSPKRITLLIHGDGNVVLGGDSPSSKKIRTLESQTNALKDQASVQQTELAKLEKELEKKTEEARGLQEQLQTMKAREENCEDHDPHVAELKASVRTLQGGMAWWSDLKGVALLAHISTLESVLQDARNAPDLLKSPYCVVIERATYQAVVNAFCDRPSETHGLGPFAATLTWKWEHEKLQECRYICDGELLWSMAWNSPMTSTMYMGQQVIFAGTGPAAWRFAQIVHRPSISPAQMFPMAAPPWMSTWKVVLRLYKFDWAVEWGVWLAQKACILPEGPYAQGLHGGVALVNNDGSVDAEVHWAPGMTPSALATPPLRQGSNVWSTMQLSEEKVLGTVPRFALDKLLHEISVEYSPTSYNLFSRNCLHCCETFIQRLGLGSNVPAEFKAFIDSLAALQRW